MEFGDVQLTPELLRLCLCWSKTDQRARGAVISLRRSTDLLICPVRSLESYL